MCMKYITMFISSAAKLIFLSVFLVTFIVVGLTIGGMSYGALVEAGYIERSDDS